MTRQAPDGGDGGCPAGASAVRVDSYRDLQAVMRDKSVVQDPHVSADNHLTKSHLGEVNVREFLDGILNFTDGPVHGSRRRMLNQLVRPEELVRFREEIVLPSVDRWMSRAVQRRDDGTYGCDLAAVVERIFLEFAAKIIGLRGVETNEGVARLRECVVPIFGGLSAQFFEDRETVTKAGLEAKSVFVEEYYRPSYDAVKADLEKVAAGELAEDDVPLNLLRLIVSGADSRYLDEETAIREAILFFVATTGTSTQAVLSTVDDLTAWFGQHPEDAHLVDDLDFISRALQESLRLKAPYVAYTTRLALADVQAGAFSIKAGDEIHAMIPRAGRDTAVYGPDADEFNPHREVPEGVNRYGLAFSTGPHQCLGLRSVLGNDGRSGSHVRLLQGLFHAGVRPDPDEKPQVLAMRMSDNEDENVPTYMSYPAIFTNWKTKS